MTKISEETRLSRPSLYKALSHGAKAQFGNNNENFEIISILLIGYIINKQAYRNNYYC